MTDGRSTGASSITLEIEGMTCTGCVARVEGKLNALESVNAAVNLATDRVRLVVAAVLSLPQCC